MSDLPTAKVEPTASPLPPRPQDDPLTPSQWRTLLAFSDAIVPDVEPKAIARPQSQLAVPDNEYSTALSHLSQQCERGGQLDKAKEYLQERPSDNPAFKDGLWRYVGQYVPADAKFQLATVLSVLE
ncbi:MAG: hypothetical protein INR71_03790 [Terriglobus roseus]|nr:hypothetical protein [Terriglobus roseus]